MFAAPIPIGGDPLASIFCCPRCGGDLSADEAAYYECGSCHSRFPIAGGIPRFVEQLPSSAAQVQRAFDFEHRRHKRSLLTQFGPQLVDQFLADCRIKPEFFRDKLVLDAGCGSGRWSYALAHLGASVTAVDLTSGGVESTYAELGSRPNVRVAQANIFELPFRPESFDFVMSWGVLHHTRSTREAFDRLIPLVKPGGTLYVMVYEKYPPLMAAGTEALRFFMRRMSDERRYEFCRHLIVDARTHPRRANVLSKFLMIAAYDPEVSALDAESYQFGLFDAYSPQWNHMHSREEIAGWFRDIGFHHITVVDSPHGAVKVRGTKPASRPRPPAPPRSSTTGDTEHAARWLEQFRAQHGRPLRVLHLGNIANNGYLNAKIQRRVGIEADVASFDYYHVMGTPEWEDAPFEGEVDEFLPDWWSVDLGGYERPKWFVQGPTQACIDYLLALRAGDGDPATAWRRLRYETWLVTRGSRVAAAARGARLIKRAVRSPRSALHRIRTTPEALPQALGLPPWMSNGFVRSVYIADLAARKTRGLARAAAAAADGVPPKQALAIHVLPTRLSHALPPESAQQPRAAVQGSQADVRGATELAERAVTAPELGDSTNGDRPDPDSFEPLARLFDERFPWREDRLTPPDHAGWQQAAELWRPVFDQYDIVQAYATYPIMPLLAGTTSFAAYEHGTLRDIPFENTPVGRTTALGYRESPAVFVTNADDLAAADRLGIPRTRVVALPHAVDTKKLFDFTAAHSHVAPTPEAELTLFAPARHDWVEGMRSQLKGNDRIVRALRMVRDGGHRVLLVFVEWGRHVEETKRLVSELGLENDVAWITPLRKQALWRRYLSSHAVVDQFVMEAIGGVTFEAMALGCRVITALDPAVNERFFGAAPPVLAAGTPDEIAARMQQVVDDPFDANGVGRAAQEWVERHHSSERIVNLQLAAYERLLENHVP